MNMNKYEKSLKEAIKYFWTKRDVQIKKQGGATGKKDYGNRGAVTGGAQLDGFIELFEMILKDTGLPGASIHRKKTTLPGYYRPTKEWDLVIVHKNELLAAIEFKSQVGPSFGNNFNNRVEEALGSSTDLWTAFREGAFQISRRPWLGYFLLLEKDDKSVSSIKINEPHFKVFKNFVNTSYKDRYQIFCEKLLRERLYDAACYLMSDKTSGFKSGGYEEPETDLGFKVFCKALIGKVISAKSM
jgi:hypothetical protein